MTAAIFAAILIAIFIYWNVRLPFYRDRFDTALEGDEVKCFSPRCRSFKSESGSDRAVLFIHGFPTTPAMYEYPRSFFAEHGYDVYAPLIPTFGADWHDFEKTDFSQWYAFIENLFMDISKRHAKTFVVGVSMGGAMTLRLAEEHGESIAAIAVLSAPVTYNSLIRDRLITDPLAYFVRTVALFVPSIGAGTVDGKPDGEDGDEEWVGYKGVFPRQGLSLIWNLKRIRKNLGKVGVPMISIHDRNDRTVPFGNQKIILSGVGSTTVESLSPSMEPFRHSRHSLLMYYSTRSVYTEAIFEFFERF